jgi:hypothetical protein
MLSLAASEMEAGMASWMQAEKEYAKAAHAVAFEARVCAKLGYMTSTLADLAAKYEAAEVNYFKSFSGPETQTNKEA